MRSASLLVLPLLALATAQPVTAQAGGATLVATHEPGAAQGTPTFYADVLPILQQNCQSCHQEAGMNMGGMVAPWPLVSYEDVAPRARRIAGAVVAGRMPPWSAASMHKGQFGNERILEDDQKATIIAWADGGTPAGDPADAPTPPAFLSHAAMTGGWSAGQPDLILEFASRIA